MGLLQKRCTKNLFRMLTLLEIAGTLALMFYALLYEVGNLVNLPDKRIGFYNFCLWNDTAGELQCLDNKHLEAIGISLLQIALARVCVYSCLVFILFYFFFVLTVNCTSTEMCNLHLHLHPQRCAIYIYIIPFIKMIILSGGLVMFLLQTSWWIQFSDFTGGFLALLGTQALLLLQILTAFVYLAGPSTHV